MIRAVVFDLWNTLAHSHGGNPFQRLQALLRPLQAEHYEALSRDGMMRPYADAEAFLDAWRDRLEFDGVQMESMAEAFAAANREATLYPETLSVLDRTRELARLGLLSNTQSFELNLLDRLGLQSCFRVRGLSAELGALKPEAAIFEAMQRKLGLFPGEIAMVGDSWRNDVEGALAAGWTAIWINREGRPRPEHDSEAEWVELPSLERVPEVIANLQAGARCGTCLG